MKITASFATAALGSLLCVAAPAAARQPWLELLPAKRGEPVSVRIDVSDLDLTDQSGERRMRARVRTAAGLVCARTDFNQSAWSYYPGYLSPEQACKSDSVAAARPALDALIEAARRGERIAVVRLSAHSAAR
jgi:UrcA family protein